MRESSLKDRAPRWVKDGADAVTRRYAIATVADRPLPDFMVIGTKRGGTTSLFNYLSSHPGILGLYPQVRGKKGTEFFFPAKYHPARRSLNWYRSHFHTHAYRRRLAKRLGYQPLSFEASPYYMWDPRTAARVQAAAPQMKAIAVIREPVRRAWSHYQERVQNGVEPLSFHAALDAEDSRLAGEAERMLDDPTYYSAAFDWYSYRRRGEYLEQIKRWHTSFPPEQLLVIRSEDLYRDTQLTMDRICTFLGIPPAELPTTRAYNATWRTREEPPGRTAADLSAHFAPLNRDLEAYLGVPLGW